MCAGPGAEIGETASARLTKGPGRFDLTDIWNRGSFDVTINFAAWIGRNIRRICG
jgi:hypothetical protein